MKLASSLSVLACLGAVLLGSVAIDANAQVINQEAAQDPALLHQAAQRFADQLASARAQNIGGVAHVNVGQPDVRLRLAACAELQAFQPPGARPVGKTLVGVRCMSGRPWQVFLPADIHIEAPVWVTLQSFPAGHVLAPEDLAQRSQEVLVTEGENHTLTAIDSPPFGAILARSVAAETSLRANDLHDAARVAPGDAVQVVYAGAGFEVETEGKTVNAAGPGQSVQVRMATGSVISGVLQQEHIVRVEM